MNFKHPLILASSSPRRQFLMREAGFIFEIEKPEVDETFPDSLPVEQVARYLALKKSENFRSKIQHEVILTADTVVILEGAILNKPADKAEALEMLTRLSGKTHQVMTGVCILSVEKEESFDDTTDVTFKQLSPQEIEFYIDQYKPYDKAGAYGAQDCLPAGVNPCSNAELEFLACINKPELIEKTLTGTQAGIGMVAIQSINGSYFNVMGLPIHKVYQHLTNWK